MSNIYEIIKNYNGSDIKTIENLIENRPESVNIRYSPYDGMIINNVYSETPLDLAARKGFVDIVELLFKHNAMPQKVMIEAINGFTANDYSPVYILLIQKIIQYQGGNDPNINAEALASLITNDKKPMNSTIPVEVKMGYKLEIIELLLGLPINWNYHNIAGASLPQLALFHCYPLVPIFINKGADIRQVLEGPYIDYYKETGRQISIEQQNYIDLARSKSSSFQYGTLYPTRINSSERTDTDNNYMRITNKY